MELSLLAQLGLALGLGLLVGLEREWAVDEVAGIRTFALITVLGTLASTLAVSFGGWIVAAGGAGLAALIAVANFARQRTPSPDTGITTEVAALVMFLVGAAIPLGYVVPAIVLGGSVAVLLHWKVPLHTFTERIGKDDFAAIIRLVLVALVILPLLPDRDMGPFQVLNPFRIWLMVVLIVSISTAGYVASKIFGDRTGSLASGLLGGLISSTATTVSYARRTVDRPRRSPAATLVITLASAVVFGRVLVEVALVAPGHFRQTAGPLGAMLALMALLSVVLLATTRGGEEEEVRDRGPPSDLMAAIVFALLYAAVLLGVALARENLGRGGLFVVAALSGLTDVDAITLSTAQLMKSGGLEPTLGWKVIQVGALSNLVFKGGIVVALGHRRLRSRILGVFGLGLAGGLALLLLWPG